VFLDLSGNLEKYSLELMRESKRIFLVTTPETPALQLAREKEQFLTDLDLGDRISVVLNRWSRRSVLGKDEVAQIIGRPVDFTITNDYRAVHAAVANAAPVAQSGDLGSQFEALARMALNETRPTDRSIRRFIRQFSLVPARFCGDHA
jgi:Flp pilus assembly CpaE family ATPase